tara:strand:+ start:25303 stop:25590 length:288 start_codon:yes stop_codon:yes gene_type:complete
MSEPLNRDFRRRVARELAKLRDLWVDMRRDGLGIESDDGTRSPEEEFLLAEAEFAFSLFARAHLTKTMGTSSWHKAMINGQFPEDYGSSDDEAYE